MVVRETDSGIWAAPPLGSVVIPAHDEARVIKRCLDGLFEGLAPGDLEVVVVCNGCPDDTPAVARSSGHPIRVIERPTASKPAALRIGDDGHLLSAALPGRRRRAEGRRRPGRARATAAGVAAGLQSATSGGASLPFAATTEPGRAFRRCSGRCGGGVYGLSAAGLQRFDAFPDLVADDLADRHFDPSEVEIIDCAPVVVTVPRRSRDLVRVLRRTTSARRSRRPSSISVTPARDPRLRDAGPAPACRDGRSRRSTQRRMRPSRQARARSPSCVAGPSLATGRWGRDDSSRVA